MNVVFSSNAQKKRHSFSVKYLNYKRDMSDNNDGENPIEKFCEDYLIAEEQDKTIDQVRVERAIVDFLGEDTVEEINRTFQELSEEESETAGDESC